MVEPLRVGSERGEPVLPGHRAARPRPADPPWTARISRVTLPYSNSTLESQRQNHSQKRRMLSPRLSRTEF